MKNRELKCYPKTCCISNHSLVRFAFAFALDRTSYENLNMNLKANEQAGLEVVSECWSAL